MTIIMALHFPSVWRRQRNGHKKFQHGHFKSTSSAALASMEHTNSSMSVSELAVWASAQLRSKAEQILAGYCRQAASLEALTATWTQIQLKASEVRKNAKAKIKINVGGTDFATSKTTLTSRFPTSLFNVLISTDVWIPSDGVYFFDRDPGMFDIVLDYLRDGELQTTTLKTMEDFEELKEELKFFNLPFDVDQETGGSCLLKKNFFFVTLLSFSNPESNLRVCCVAIQRLSFLKPS
jgi:hypothetical protein